MALVLEAADDPLIPLITTVPSPSNLSPCDEVAALLFIQRQHERLRTGQGYSLAIAEPDGRAIGQVGLWTQQHGRASVGYWVVRSGRGQGAAGQTGWAGTPGDLTLRP
ncbi:GNAT family N-acetyltransferase [Deinococcus altitudinis]|uniref:GNAT family N-acetyltransferase n=1 Tax=Deinococcus altitudinis TaxID=468914 RepID=UPI003892428A